MPMPRTLLLLALPLLLAACVSQSKFDQQLSQTERLGRDLAGANEKIVSLKQERTRLQNELAQLNQRLVEVLQQNSQLQRELLAANAMQQRQQSGLDSRQLQLEQQQRQLTAMQQTNDQLLDSVAQLNQELAKEKVAKAARLAKVKQTYDELVGALKDEIKRGELTISNLEGQLSVNLLNNILFDSGRAELKSEGQKVLKSLGDVLGRFPDKALRIEGHTDNVQISSRLVDTFPSNWELSTARATSVVHFLQDQVGLPGERLIAAGYSEYQPVADNDSTDGRANNRRIQIFLVPFRGDTSD